MSNKERKHKNNKTNEKQLNNYINYKEKINNITKGDEMKKCKYNNKRNVTPR